MRTLGVEQDVVDAPTPISAPLDATRAFIVGEAQRGPITGQVLLRSSRDWTRPLGARTGPAIPIYDHVDVMARLGVQEFYFGRIVGAGAAPATATAAGTGAGGSLIFTAAGRAYQVDEAQPSPGVWGDGATGGLSYEIVNGPNGATERQVIFRLGGQEVERSPVFTARADALAFNVRGNYVRIDLGADATLPVVAGPTNLAGGVDGAASVTADLIAALGRLPRTLGPGQLLAPGRTSTASQTEILRACQGGNRVALLDMPQGVSVAALIAQAATLRALGLGAAGMPRLGGAWAQYASLAGVVPGTTRTVGWSAIQAGLTARAEREAGHSNVAPVGLLGIPPNIVRGVDRYFDETADGDADDLVTAGVNVVVNRYGRPRNYSFRSLDDPASSQWVDLSHSREAMSLQARFDAAGEEMRHVEIDSSGGAAGLYASKLRAGLDIDWRRGALYGNTAEDAYEVDTGPTVNTPETAAARALYANVGFRASEHPEKLYITVAKVPTTQEV